VIETERLLLRGWRETDRAPFRAMAADDEVMRFLPATSAAEADAAIDRMIATEAEHGHVFWALERKADGAFLGFCGIMPPRPPLHETEIGWRLARHAWGQGYAREAAQASLAWAWANLEVPAVMAMTVAGNVRSWQLMERLGMTRQPDEDFDHPALAEDDPLRPHIVYRIQRPTEGPTKGSTA